MVSAVPQGYSATATIKTLVESMPAQIKVGDKLPDVRLARTASEAFSTLSELNGSLVVVFTVPKAFTKVCSEQHLLGFVIATDEFRKLGVEKIACIAVNTLDEMRAWAKEHDPLGKITMIPDWGAELVWKMGLGMDKSEPRGLGFVAKRSVLILQNGRVCSIKVEEDAGICLKSSAISTLADVFHYYLSSLGSKEVSKGDEKKEELIKVKA